MPVQNDDIDLTDIQGELEARAKFIASPLDRMVDKKEISAYEVIVAEGHEKTFLEDDLLDHQGQTGELDVHVAPVVGFAVYSQTHWRLSSSPYAVMGARPRSISTSRI